MSFHYTTRILLFQIIIAIHNHAKELKLSLFISCVFLKILVNNFTSDSNVYVTISSLIIFLFQNSMLAPLFMFNGISDI